MYFLGQPTKNKVRNKLLYDSLIGVDLDEMANSLEMSPRSIIRWIYEDSVPEQSVAKAVAETLKIPLYRLFPVVRNHGGVRRNTTILEE